MMKAFSPAKEINYDELMHSVRTVAANLGLIAAGSIIYTIGINGVLIPKGFLSGGVLGLAVLIHYLVPFTAVGVLYLVLNVPLIFLGWIHVSRRFVLYSLLGSLFFSATLSIIHPPVPDISDLILAAILAGVICGTGAGIILRSMGSAGGMDILGIYLHKRFGFRIGSILFASNALVLFAGAYLYDVELTLYSVIFLFTGGRVTDAILTGFNRRKSLLIISENSEAIGQKILNEMGRGMTYLRGEGAFTRKEKNVIFTITTLTELPKMKELILNEDPEAFVVVNDTLEVLGKRHGRKKVY
jgi:uncharacterized membrane-anchored protein YitT (DUF2179 family)